MIDYNNALSKNPSGRNSRIEADIAERFPPLHNPTKYSSEPCTILDSEGNVLLWYLPGALRPERVVSEHIHSE